MSRTRSFVAFSRCGLGALMCVTGLAMAGCASAPADRPEPVEIVVDRPGAVDRLSQAIQIKTISYGGPTPTQGSAFKELHEFLERSYPEAHRALKREVVKAHSLLYTWQGSDASLQPILLAAHMDVVPVAPGTLELWQQKPFQGTVDAQGVIWGRGALDDKLSVLGLLEAVEVLLDQGFTPRRTIYFAFGHDEELDGEGALEIAQKLQERGQRLHYVLDEGSIIGLGLVPGVDKPVAMIGVAEKGYLTIRLSVDADGGHSSVPPKQTAIGRLARALERLQSNPLPAELRPPVSEMLEAVAPEMPTLQGVAMSNQWLFGGLITSLLTDAPTSNAMVRTTTAPTVIRGGDKDNVLPQSASALVNFRILPGDTIASVTEQVRQTIADEKVKVDPVSETASEPVLPSPIDSDGYREVERTVYEIFPESVVAPALVIAATDSRHYQNVTKNIFRFLPIALTSERLSGMHGNNERLESESYNRLIAFYIQLMRNSAG